MPTSRIKDALAEVARRRGRSRGLRAGLDLCTLGLLALLLGLIVNRFTLPSLGVPSRPLPLPWVLGGVAFSLIGCTTLGALASLFLRGSGGFVAGLLDRRYGLEDRLRSALELGGSDGPFAAALEAEATRELERLPTTRLWPMPRGRWRLTRFLLLLIALLVLSQYLQVPLPGLLPGGGGGQAAVESRPQPRCSYDRAEPSDIPGVWLIRYRLFGALTDPRGVEIEFARQGEPFRRATEGPSALSDGIEGLEASPDGVPHVFAWEVHVDVPEAPGGRPCDVLLRVRPAGAEIASCGGIVFCAGEDSSLSCALTGLSFDGSGWEVRYLLFSEAGEVMAAPVFEFAPEGETFRVATPAPDTAAEPVVATPEGSEHVFRWDSTADCGAGAAPAECPCDSLFRITVGEGASFCEGRIRCETTPLSCRLDGIEVADGRRLVHFTLFGPAGAYSPVALGIVTGDGQLVAATTPAADPVGYLSAPDGVAGLLEWDAGADVADAPCEIDLELSVGALGSEASARCRETLPFGGGAAVAGMAVRALPDNPCTWPVDFVLVDPSECPADVRIEYAIGAGAGAHWFDATEAQLPADDAADVMLDASSSGTVGLSTSATGIRHTYLWNAGRDLGPDASTLVGSGVRLRVRTEGAGAEGAYLDDAIPAPSCRITGAGASPTMEGVWSVAYELFACAKPGELECDVALSFSIDGGIEFDRATRGIGGDPPRGRSAHVEGAPHTFAWNYPLDLPLLEPREEPCMAQLELRVLGQSAAGESTCRSSACPDPSPGGGGDGEGEGEGEGEGDGDGDGDGGGEADGGGEDGGGTESADAPPEGGAGPGEQGPGEQGPGEQGPGEQGPGELAEAPPPPEPEGASPSTGDEMVEESPPPAGAGSAQDSPPLFGEETQIPEAARFQDVGITPLFDEEGGFRDQEVLVPPMRGRGDEPGEGEPRAAPPPRHPGFDGAVETALRRHLVSPGDRPLVRRYFELLRRFPTGAEAAPPDESTPPEKR